MSITDMNKDAFKEFAKIVLFCCNNSKRKVYIRHLKIMLGYYLIKTQKLKNEKSDLLHISISEEGVEIAHFEEYLTIMHEIGFIDMEKNIYGTIVGAKKKLEEKAYENSELEVLQDIIEKSTDNLQEYLDINISDSQFNKKENMI